MKVRFAAIQQLFFEEHNGTKWNDGLIAQVTQKNAQTCVQRSDEHQEEVKELVLPWPFKQSPQDILKDLDSGEIEKKGIVR